MFFFIIIIGIKALGKAVTFGIIYTLQKIPSITTFQRLWYYRHNNEQGLQFHPWLCWNSTTPTLKNQNTIEALS